MTTPRKTEGGPDSAAPEGARPLRQSDRENERIRKEGEAESSGRGSERLDQEDEAFIKSK